MKKIFGFVLIIVLVMLLVGSGLADNSVQYSVTGTNVTISLPSDWLYGDRGVKNDSPICKYLGYNKDKFIDTLSENEIFIGFPIKDYDYMLFAYRYETEWKDFSMMSTEEILSWGDKLGSLLEDRGEVLISSDVVSLSVPFFKAVSIDRKNQQCIYYHYTAVAGSVYEFKMVVYTGKYSKADDEMCDQIAGSVVFGDKTVENAREDETINDEYEYAVNPDGSITIKEYTSKKTEVIIPSELDGKIVSSISSMAFYSNDMIKVVIPAEVKSIDGNPFAFCYKLKEICLAEDNDSFVVKEGVLYTKDMKTIVSVPAGWDVTEFRVPDGVESILVGAFSNCKILEKVELPSSLRFIGSSAFNDCDGLLSISIPDGVQELSGTFSRCDNLSECILPEGLTTIGNLTFYSCYSLHEVALPSTVDMLGNGCFFASGIEELVLPEGIQSIPGDAFLRCALRRITIPESVTSIDDLAFGDEPGSHDPDLVFVVKDGSYALSYAKEMNIQYEILGEGSMIEGSEAVDDKVTPLTDGYWFGGFYLLPREVYVYTTRDDKDLSYTEQFVFDHDDHVKALVSYDGFYAQVISYPRQYKTALTPNECLVDIIKYGHGGFGGLSKRITVDDLGNNIYMIMEKDDVTEGVNVEFMDVYVFYKNGIVKISSNHTFTNDMERERFIAFLKDMADCVYVFDKLPENN